MPNDSWMRRITAGARRGLSSLAGNAPLDAGTTSRAATTEAATNEAEADVEATAEEQVWAWIERGGVDLGHDELIARIHERANAAYLAGDRVAWSQLNDAAESLWEEVNVHGQAAIETAVTLPHPASRQAYLDSQRAELRRQVQVGVARYVDDLDLTVPEAFGADREQEILAESARLLGMERVDDDVRHAYHVALNEARDADPGKRWLYLTQVREQLAHQAEVDGQEPHSRQDVDAALRRLTHSDQFTAHVIPEDAEYLLTDEDREAAVRFGGADRHMMLIDYPEDDQPTVDQTTSGVTTVSTTQTTAAVQDDDDFVEKSLEENFEDSMEAQYAREYGDTNTDADADDEAERAAEAVDDPIGDLVYKSEVAEMNAERLDDADHSAQAAELRATAEQLRKEATQVARDHGFTDPFGDDEDDDRDDDRNKEDAATENADTDEAPTATTAASEQDQHDKQDEHDARDDRAERDQHNELTGELIEERHHAAGVRRDDDSSATDADAETSGADRDDDATSAVEESVEVQPVSEATACAVAVTRARCAVERMQQQVDAADQVAAVELDDELARWHADDAAAQADNNRVADDTAQLDRAPVRGE